MSLEVAEYRTKVGRNDSCPCGSGKKFKRCCLDAGLLDHHGVRPQNTLILPAEIGDHGEPQVNQQFFEQNPFLELSPQRMIYSDFVNPWVESIINRWVKQTLSRGKEEAERIRSTNDPTALIEILKSRPDTLNHRLLIDRILERREAAIPLLIQELHGKQDHCFVEQAVRILYWSKLPCSREMLKLICSTALDPYTLSLLRLVLGMTGGPEVLKRCGTGSCS